jgi:hypothetical protein
VALGVTMKMRGMVPVLAVAAGVVVTPATFQQNPGILYMCSLCFAAGGHAHQDAEPSAQPWLVDC